MKPIAVLTESRYENPSNPDWYVANILKEDGLLVNALLARGVEAVRVDWARPGFDWSGVEAAVFRTTWDYFHRFEEFQSWLDKAGSQTIFINPLEQIRWNMDKYYLADLERAGVNVVPTHFMKAGEKHSLKSLHEKLGWEKTILKPAVSGAARHTYLLTAENRDKHEHIFQTLLENEAMLLQPFQEDIVKRGEVSLMVIGGQYTHSVLKVARKGDFRVQDDFGGTVHPYQPSREEMAFAEAAVKACNPMPLYARVDVLYANDGSLALGELELIEPELWFREYPPAADLLAEAILQTLSTNS
ncbi:MAG: hypothetical protein GYB31_12110 [Bacteroidetes bacterium]|nr:hypothetical protein [Bacteroidota bacterium]